MTSPSKCDAAAGAGGQRGAGGTTYTGTHPIVISGSSVSAPNVVTNVPTSVNLKTFLANVGNDTHVRLAPGTFTVSPTLLNSNLVTSTAIGAVILASRTNVTIEGVPGLTILDGSSGLGEVLFLSNCFNVTIRGVTVIGYTNHNFMELPSYGGTTNQNSYLWAGVQVYACAQVTFDNVRIERHADHGIQDKGAESTAASILNDVISTNQIIVRNSYFTDCGGMRTNAGGGLAADGTAIVCTGWLIEGSTFEGNYRGAEPYNEGDANARKFFNCVIRGNIFRNNAEHDITFAGSTNSDNTLIEGNLIEAYPGATYHGTNFFARFAGVVGVGINLNGGDFHTAQRNVIRGKPGGGIFVQTSSDNPVVGVSLIGNTISGVSNSLNQAYGIFAGDPVYGKAFPVRNLYAAGNTISQCKTYGIYALGVADSTFEGNQLLDPLFPGAGPAIVLQSFSSSIVSNVTLRANTIHDFGASQMTYGINATAGVLASYLFENKIFGGSSGTVDNQAGSGLVEWNTTSLSASRIARQSDVNTASNSLHSLIGAANGLTNNQSTPVTFASDFVAATIYATGDVATASAITANTGSIGNLAVNWAHANKVSFVDLPIVPSSNLTNYTLSVTNAEYTLNMTNAVRFTSVAGATSGTKYFPCVTLTNFTGSSQSIEFTNTWIAYGTATNSIAAGKTARVAFEVEGTNVRYALTSN